MNTILQKRIEEAKQKEYPLPPMVDGAVCKVLAMAEQTAYKKGATFALQNQWIIVEEALPEKEGRYLCNYHHKFSNSDDECDCVDFGLFKDGKWYVANNEVTHWMAIPQQEGGEK